MDDTKRKEWEKAYDKGAFRFDDTGKSVDVDLEEMASNEGLQWEWIRHNLDAVKVSHGFCFISAKQGCKYQVNPCLNANGGKPCKHLAVTPDFAPMYEFDIEMKKKVIEEGKQRGDEYKHWVEKNEKELHRIQEIYDIIKDGQTYFQKKDAICHKGEETCPINGQSK